MGVTFVTASDYASKHNSSVSGVLSASAAVICVQAAAC